VWGERTLGTVLDDMGTSRVRFCQRPDRLFTYYLETRREERPAAEADWCLVRDGGLFADEAEMRDEARRSLSWTRL
jgi:hypothetical protein